MSADLVWAIIKNNNSFLVKRQNVQFSTEPANLLNVNSFKYSGLANYKVIFYILILLRCQLLNRFNLECLCSPCCSWCSCYHSQGQQAKLSQEIYQLCCHCQDPSSNFQVCRQLDCS
jgi:hypothetical protein